MAPPNVGFSKMVQREEAGVTGLNQDATPKIEIFFSQMCGLCHEAMDFFREKGLAFEAYEVHWQGDELVDSEPARELKRRVPDVEFVPQIFIHGRHIAGYRTLAELIKTGEIEDILSAGGAE